jgi:hypothetical protein
MMGKAKVLLEGPGDEMDLKPWPIIVEVKLLA